MPPQSEERTDAAGAGTPEAQISDQEAAIEVDPSKAATTNGQQDAGGMPTDTTAKAQQATEKAAENLPTAQQAAVQAIAAGSSQLYDASADNPQQIASATNTQLLGYYTNGLIQSNKSFQLARNAALLGVGFFIAAVVFLLWTESQEIGIVSAIGGAIVEVIAGLAFVLYGKATAQLDSHRRSMELTQRFLLANSIANSSLDSESKEKALGTLVNTISQWGSSSSRSEDTDKKSRNEQSPRRSSRDQNDSQPNQ